MSAWLHSEWRILHAYVPACSGPARASLSGKRDFKTRDAGTETAYYPDDWKDQADPLRYITQRYTKGIEDFVRADPGQYLWVHRRWKTRPKGETPEAFD